MPLESWLIFWSDYEASKNGCDLPHKLLQELVTVSPISASMISMRTGMIAHAMNLTHQRSLLSQA